MNPCWACAFLTAVSKQHIARFLCHADVIFYGVRNQRPVDYQTGRLFHQRWMMPQTIHRFKIARELPSCNLSDLVIGEYQQLSTSLWRNICRYPLVCTFTLIYFWKYLLCRKSVKWMSLRHDCFNCCINGNIVQFSKLSFKIYLTNSSIKEISVTK